MIFTLSGDFILCAFAFRKLFVCLSMAAACREETFRGGFQQRPFVPGSTCAPEVLEEGVDVVVDRLSSAGLQDDRCLLPVQVCLANGGDGKANSDIRVDSNASAEITCRNSLFIGGHDPSSSHIHADAEVEPRFPRIKIPALHYHDDDDDDDDNDVFQDSVLLRLSSADSHRSAELERSVGGEGDVPPPPLLHDTKSHNVTDCVDDDDADGEVVCVTSKVQLLFRFVGFLSLSIVTLLAAMALMLAVCLKLEVLPTHEPVTPLTYIQFTWQFYTIVMTLTTVLMTTACMMTASRWSRRKSNNRLEMHKHVNKTDDDDDDDDVTYYECAFFVNGGVSQVQGGDPIHGDALVESGAEVDPIAHVEPIAHVAPIAPVQKGNPVKAAPRVEPGGKREHI